MRIMQNTLYVLTPESYLKLDGETIVIEIDGAKRPPVPLHNLEGIVTFGYAGASPRLMEKCAAKGIALSFLNPNGRFYAQITGEIKGNVLLRKNQYRLSDDENDSMRYARNFIFGKLTNVRNVIQRAVRDHGLRINAEKAITVSEHLRKNIRVIRIAHCLETIRGIEGESAKLYFSIFNDFILQQKEDFIFTGRNKRPPTDAVNAMLSFLYTLLAHDVSAALMTVGLDPYVGFLHRDRPGRISLALDLMEELRPPMVDRLVLSLINKCEVKITGFITTESGAVVMDADTRKTIINAWQSKKKEKITHPYTEEKIPWGLVPYAQALLLARQIRGDLEEYPPFLWK